MVSSPRVSTEERLYPPDLDTGSTGTMRGEAGLLSRPGRLPHHAAGCRMGCQDGSTQFLVQPGGPGILTGTHVIKTMMMTRGGVSGVFGGFLSSLSR